MRIGPIPVTRRDLRLVSGLVMFTYIAAHLVNHAVGLWSIPAAEAGLAAAVRVWHSLPGTLLLYGAAAAHVGVHSGVVVQGEIAFRGRRSRAGVGRAVDAARLLPEAARSAGRRFAISASALDEAGALAPTAGPARVLALGGADVAAWIVDAVPDDGRGEPLRA